MQDELSPIQGDGSSVLFLSIFEYSLVEFTGLKLRNDLVISRQSASEEILFVLKDPATDRFFRLKEVEYFIAQQLDGVATSEIIQHRVEENFGISLSAENLSAFINHLFRVGLVANGETPTVAQRRKRIAGDIFYLRYKLFDPERLFNWLIRRVRFFFTPLFVILSAVLVIIAFGITITYWPEIMAQFNNLFRFGSLLFAWFVVLAVITLHEFAHGLTCRYFGGKVREIGFMLIYFQPAFYCNVSDAWLFPKKSQRMWVTFAGAYFEIFLWAISTLLWLVLDPDTSLNHLVLVIVATSAIKSFFNLNPLIKLDGYYLLSDWLDIPNLRQKAFNYLGNQFKKLRGAGNDYFTGISNRDRWVFLVYAVLSGIYTWWLLATIILWFGGFMINRYQGWGFVFFSITLCLFFRRPVRKWLLRVTKGFRFGHGKPFALSRRYKFLFGLLALMAVLFFCRMELRVSGSFAVLPEHNADVRAMVEGIIEEIYVDEGSVVDKGTVIARLSDRDYQAELQKTLADIGVKQAQLKLLKAGPRQQEVQLAKTHLAKARERFNFARSDLERSKPLFEIKAISKKEFEEIMETAAVREKELQEEQEKLKLLRAGSRPEEIEGLEAEIQRLKVHQGYLQEQLQSLTITSPIAGIVTTHKLKEKVGENVKKGDLVAEVYDLKKITVEISIPEKEIGDVKTGQKVVFKARAYPHLTFTGNVDHIAPVASQPTEGQQARTILVSTELSNRDGLLKPEMTGNAKIYCGKRRLIHLATRRLIRYLRVETWSWW